MKTSKENIILSTIQNNELTLHNNISINDNSFEHMIVNNIERNIIYNSFSFLFYEDMFYECFVNEIKSRTLSKQNITDIKVKGYLKKNSSPQFIHNIFTHIRKIKLKSKNNNSQNMFCFLFINDDLYSIRIDRFIVSLFRNDDQQYVLNNKIQLHSEQFDFSGQICTYDFLLNEDLKQIKLISQKQIIEDV